MTAFDHYAESIRYWAAHDLPSTLDAAMRAYEADRDELLYEDAVRYLHREVEQGRGSLYNDVGAFAAFVGGGSNLPLYDNCRALLVERLTALAPDSVLDIGSGEGTIIVPVAKRLASPPHLTLCDPALPLLERAVHFAEGASLDFDAFPYCVEDLLTARQDRWDAVIATWSLQSLPPDQRARVLAPLAARADHLFVAEFDDPSNRFADPLDIGRIRHIHDRYRIGLREYPGEEGRRVRRGFLMPVMYGYFSQERRSTYEQPIEAWEAELAQRGWQVVARRKIAPYWWADAYLIEAVPNPATPTAH